MNENEKVGYEYLIQQGYSQEDIDFDQTRSIDFICSDGKKYEVKVVVDPNYVKFTAKQWKEIQGQNPFLIIVKDGKVTDVFPLNELANKDYMVFLQRRQQTVLKPPPSHHSEWDSVAEHLGRDTRYRLFLLIYEIVQQVVDKQREVLKKRGRPGYVTKTAEFLGVSRETASAWKNRKYQAMNPNAEILVKKAWELNTDATAEILRADLESHRRILEAFLKAMDNEFTPQN